MQGGHEGGLCGKARELLREACRIDGEITACGLDDRQWVLDWKDGLNKVSITYRGH